MREIRVLGVPIAIVDAELNREDDGYAEYDGTSGEIRIGTATTPRRRWEFVKHELAHAVWDALHFYERLQNDFGLAPDVASRIEEVVAGQFIPVYTDSLERADLLQDPFAESYRKDEPGTEG